MDNKIEVLNRLLDEINLSLQQVCDRIDMLSDQKQEISQNLKELYNNEDNLNKRKKVLEEIISDEKLKSGIIVGPDMTAIVKKGATITSPLYPGETIATEIHMTKSSIAQGIAEELINQMERDHKHGNV